MSASHLNFKGKPYTIAKRLLRGLWGYFPSAHAATAQPDNMEIVLCTGTTALPDPTFASGTVTLLADSDLPSGLKLYITGIVIGISTGFSGGTAGTVSLTLQDSAANAILTATQTALGTAGACIALPGSSLPTGVVDSGSIQTLAAATAAGKGIQAVLANSTAGVARISIRGYLAP